MLGRQALRLRLPYQRSFLALDRQQIAHQFGFCLFARFMRLRGLVVGFSIDLGIEPLYDSALASTLAAISSWTFRRQPGQ